MSSEASGLTLYDKFIVFVMCVVVGCAVTWYYYAQYALTLRIIALLILALILLALAMTTTFGKSGWGFIKSSRMEMRKVVWPTRQETTQTTIIVIAIVCIMCLILWVVDNIFASVISSIIL